MAKDKCIMCGKETAYDFETHIDYRTGYIEGAGQLCIACYTPEIRVSRSYITVPEDLIYNTPNDLELGSKVRELYWQSKK